MEPCNALETLRTFRHSLYECFDRRADALFEITDAILTADVLPSPVHLSLQGVHSRGWGSLYAALSKGRMNFEAFASWLSVTLSPRTVLLPSTLWTPVFGPAAMRRAAPSAGTTITLLDTRPANPSWRAGPTSSSPSWASLATVGSSRWISDAFVLPITRTRLPRSR